MHPLALLLRTLATSKTPTRPRATPNAIRVRIGIFLEERPRIAISLSQLQLEFLDLSRKNRRILAPRRAGGKNAASPENREKAAAERSGVAEIRNHFQNLPIHPDGVAQITDTSQRIDSTRRSKNCMDINQERQLARGLGIGQAEAWRAFYDAHAEPLWRWVSRRMGAHAPDVADVVQETFLAAARSAANYDPDKGSLWIWLCGIARNHVALHYRRANRHEPARHAECVRMTGDGRLQRWLEGDHESPLEALETAELAEFVRVVLTRLPADYEQLLAGRYLDGTSVEDLSLNLGTTITAVRSKLARARQAFREALAGMSDEILEAVMAGAEKPKLE